MPYSQEEIKSLWEQLREMRSNYEGDPVHIKPPTIELLCEMRSKATEESDFIAITTLLDSEYSWFGLKHERESLIREMTEQFPEEPMYWISLADILLYELEDPTKASSIIETALAKALDKGYFVRHAYNTRARIARKLKNYDQMEDTLRALIAYVPQPGSQDIDYEDDFIRDLPENAVSEDVLDKYRQLIEKRREKK